VTRVAVVGGGAIGVTAAHDMAVRGADVTLYERGDLASGASGRAAGIAYDAFAEDRDAAVAARALARFRELDAAGAVSFTECPYVWLAREGDDSAAAAIREQVGRMRAHDRDVELFDADALADRFPALETDDVAVAAVARDAGVLDPASYVNAMAERAREAGVSIRTGTEVALAEKGTTVRTPDGPEAFDAVLVATGAHSGRLLTAVGHSIAMKPYRVQALVTGPLAVVSNDSTGEASTGGSGIPSTYDATGGFYFRPRGGGLLVGDGTDEREFDPDEYDENADASFCERSRERVSERVRIDGGDVTVERAWAGLCTATPDRNPLLGPVDEAGTVFVATGWHGHGFMRAPSLGETVAEQILGGDGVNAFDPRRFDGDESFDVVEGMTVEDD
jgi:glycine/D-amino acid oxidase-like deaminating enzyme